MPRKVSRVRIAVVFVVLAVAGFATVKFVSYAQKKSRPVATSNTPAVAPNVTAVETVDDSLSASPDGNADPGDILKATVTMTNTGGDATGTTISDTPGTYLSANGANGNLTTVLTVTGDTANTIGNVNLSLNAAQGVLSNDTVGNGSLSVTGVGNTQGTANGTSVPNPLTTTNGGTVTMQSTGAYTYDPPVGFTGTDTFWYAVTNAPSTPTYTGTAQVTITVSGKIWFINNAGGACTSNCDGRLSHPFTSLTNFQAINDNGAAATHAKTGDNIFLYQSGIAYNGPVTLLSTQKLIGQDSTASLITITGLTQPSGTDPLPAMDTAGSNAVITASNANGINLGLNNTIRGLTVTNTGTGTKISGTSFGTLTLATSASPDVTVSGTGQALNLSTGTLAVPGGFVSVGSTSSGAQGINLAGISDSDGAGGSSFSFGSTTVSGSTTQGILIGTTTADINLGNT
ncbi:MAG: hypothetical protein JO314_01660, partial [Acidobacteria bacterium]|nr:hypothetical protein [Acidobacteriota bacterium]